jgi:hypothetical protein
VGLLTLQESLPWFQRGSLFWVTAQCGFTGPCSFPQQIAHWVPWSLGFRPSPHSSCAKGFSFPSPAGGAGTPGVHVIDYGTQLQPVVGSENLPMLLHVFCSFTWLRFRQSSACCLWGLGHDFPGLTVSMFLLL